MQARANLIKAFFSPIYLTKNFDFIRIVEKKRKIMPTNAKTNEYNINIIFENVNKNFGKKRI